MSFKLPLHPFSGLTGNPDECKPDSEHTSDEQEETAIGTNATPVRKLVG
jgi:hypothetical protein